MVNENRWKYRNYWLKGRIEIPKMAEISKEYAAILEHKKKYYEEYKEAWEEMIAYRTAKHIEDKILGLIRLLRARKTLLQKVESETMMGDKTANLFLI